MTHRQLYTSIRRNVTQIAGTLDKLRDKYRSGHRRVCKLTNVRLDEHSRVSIRYPIRSAKPPPPKNSKTPAR